MSVGRNTAYNLAGSILPLALSLLTIPLYLKFIGTDRYGVLSIAWLFLGYFGLFDLGLGRATAYTIAAQRDAPPEERAKTFWTAIALNAAIGFIGAGLLFLVGGWFFANVFKVDPALRSEITSAVPWLALSVPVATMTGVLTGALQGREKFLRINLVSTVSTALFQIFPLLVAWLHGPYLPLLLVSAIGARILAMFFLFAQCRWEVTKGQPIKADTARVKELLRYGGWVSLTSLFGPLLVITDRLLIGSVIGAAAVAHYSIPFQFAQRFSIVPAALTSSIFPRLSAAAEDEATRLSDQALRAILAVATPMIFVAVVLIEPFLRIWVGNTVADAAGSVGRILFIGFWGNALALVPFTRLQAGGKPNLVAWCLIAQIPPYIAGLYFGMLGFGLVGCAVAIAVRMIADHFLLSWLVDKRIAFGSQIGLNLLFLLAAAFACEFFGVVDWQLWIAVLIIGAAMIYTDWKILPDSLKHQANSFLRRGRA